MSTQTIAHSPRSARRWPLAATTLGLALAALVALAIVTQPARPAFRPAADIHPVTAAQLVELKQNQAEAQGPVVVLARALPDATTATELVELKQNQVESR